MLDPIVPFPNPPSDPQLYYNRNKEPLTADTIGVQLPDETDRHNDTDSRCAGAGLHTSYIHTSCMETSYGSPILALSSRGRFGVP